MRRLLLLFVCLIVWPNLSWANKPVILVLGDSLSAAYGIDKTQGWVSQLQNRLNQQGYRYQVINASVSGDTTRTGLTRLPAVLKQHQPQIVIVALGGNDGLRGLPFSEIEQSLGKILTHTIRHNAKPLLAGVRLPPNYGAEYNQRFTALFQRLTVQHQVSLVPQLLAGIDDQASLMQADRIHPNAAAQVKIVDNVWPVLQTMLAK